MAGGKVGLVIVISIVLISLSVAVYSQQFTTFPTSSPSTGQLKCGDPCKSQLNDCPLACPCGIHPSDINLTGNIVRYICGGLVGRSSPSPLLGPVSAITNFSSVASDLQSSAINYFDANKDAFFQELRTKTKREIEKEIRAAGTAIDSNIFYDTKSDITLFQKLLGYGSQTFKRELEIELISYLDRRKIIVSYLTDHLGEQVAPLILYDQVGNPDLKNKIVEYISTYSQARGTSTLEQETGRAWKIVPRGLEFSLFNSQKTLPGPTGATPPYFQGSPIATRVILPYPRNYLRDPMPELDRVFDRLISLALLSKEPIKFLTTLESFFDYEQWLNKWLDNARRSSIVDNTNEIIIKAILKEVASGEYYQTSSRDRLIDLVNRLKSKNLHTGVSYRTVKNSLDDGPTIKNVFLIYQLYPDYLSSYFDQEETKDIINILQNLLISEDRIDFDNDFIKTVVDLFIKTFEDLAIQNPRIDEETAQQINSLSAYLINPGNLVEYQETALTIVQKNLESIKRMSVAMPAQPYHPPSARTIIDGGYLKLPPGFQFFKSELDKLQSTLNYLNDEQGYYIRLDSAPLAGTDFWTPNKKKLSYNLWKADFYNRITYHFYSQVKWMLNNIELTGSVITEDLKNHIDKLYQKSAQGYTPILKKYRPFLPGIPGIGTEFWGGPTFIDNIKSYISTFIPESLKLFSDDPDTLVTNYLNSLSGDINDLVIGLRNILDVIKGGTIKITGLKDVVEGKVAAGKGDNSGIINPVIDLLLNSLSSSDPADTEYRGHLVDLIGRIYYNQTLQDTTIAKLIAYLENKKNPERAAIAVILEHTRNKLIIPVFREILCDPTEQATDLLQTAVRALRRLDAYDDATQNCLKTLKTNTEQKTRSDPTSSFRSLDTYVGDTISFVETGIETSLLNPDLPNAPKQSSLYDSQGYQQYKDALKLMEQADSKKQAGQLPEALNFYALARNTLKELVAAKPFGIAAQEPVTAETIKEKFVLVNSKIAEILSLIQDTSKILEEVDLLFDAAELSFHSGDYDSALKIYNDIKTIAETKLNVPRESNTVLSDAYTGISLVFLAQEEQHKKQYEEERKKKEKDANLIEKLAKRIDISHEGALQFLGDAIKFNPLNTAAKDVLRSVQLDTLSTMASAYGVQADVIGQKMKNEARGTYAPDFSGGFLSDSTEVIWGILSFNAFKFAEYYAGRYDIPIIPKDDDAKKREKPLGYVFDDLVNQFKSGLKDTQKALLFATKMMQDHGLVFNDIIDVGDDGKPKINDANLRKLKELVKKYPGVNPESVESEWSAIYDGFYHLLNNPDIERLAALSKGTGYYQRQSQKIYPGNFQAAKDWLGKKVAKGFEFFGFDTSDEPSKIYDPNFYYNPADESWIRWIVDLGTVESFASIALGELKVGRGLLALARGASKLTGISKILTLAAKLGITDATVVGELFKILPAKALSWSPLGGKRLLDMTPFHKWIWGNLAVSVGATSLGFYLDPTEDNRFARIGLMFYGGKSIADLTDFFSSSERIIAERIAAGAIKGGPLAKKALQDRLRAKLAASSAKIETVEDIRKLAKEAAEEVGLPIIPRLRLLPAGSGLQPKVVVLSGDLDVGDGVIKQEVVLGRGTEATWKTTNPHVSGQHAKLFRTRDGGLGIKDLESTNGVYVNGRKLSRGEEAVLKNGDEVSLALPEKGVKFRIEIVGSTAALPGPNAIPDDVANRLVTKLKQERVDLGLDSRETLDAFAEMEGRDVQLGPDEVFVYHVTDIKYSSSISRRGLISGYSGRGRVGGQATDDVAEQYLPDRFKGKGFTRSGSVFAHPTVLDSGLDGEVKYIERRGGAVKYKSKVKKDNGIVVDSADIAEYFGSISGDAALQRYWEKAISIDDFNKYYKPTVPNKWGNGGMVFEKVPGAPAHLPDKFEGAEVLVKGDIDPSHVTVETYGDATLKVLQSENAAKFSVLATQPKLAVMSVLPVQVATKLIGRLQLLGDLGTEPTRFLNDLVDLERRVLTGGDAEFVYINKEFAEVKGVLRSKTIGPDQVFTGSELGSEREAAELADQFLPERLRGVGHNRANSVIANPSIWDTVSGYRLGDKGVKIKVRVNPDRSLVVDGDLHGSYVIRDFNREKYIKPYLESAVTLREFKTYYRLKSLGSPGTREATVFERVPESQIPIELRGKLPQTITNPEVIIQENIPISSATVHEYGREVNSVLQAENAGRFSDLASTPAPLPPTSDLGGGAVSVGEVVDNVDDAVEVVLRDIQSEQSKEVLETLIKLSREGPQGIPTEQLQAQLPVRMSEYVPIFSVGRVEATEGFRLLPQETRARLLEAQGRILENVQELGHAIILSEQVSTGEVGGVALELWQKATDLRARIQFDLNYIRSELKDAHEIAYKYDPKTDRTVLSYKPKQTRKFYLSSDLPTQAQAVRVVFNNNFRPIKTKFTVGGVEKEVTIYFPNEEIGFGKMLEMQDSLGVEIPGYVGLRPVKGMKDTYIVATHAIFPEDDFVLRFKPSEDILSESYIPDFLLKFTKKMSDKYLLSEFIGGLEGFIYSSNDEVLGQLDAELKSILDEAQKIIKSDPNKILSALNDFPGGRDLYSRYSTAMDAISALKTHELPLNLVEPARLLNSIDKEFLMARFSLTADQLNNILLNPDQAAARHMYNEIVQTEWQAFATFGSNLEASQFQLSIKSALQQDGLIPVSIHTHPTVSTDDIIALSPSPGDYHQYRVNSDGLMFSADGTETSYLFNMIVAGKPNKYTVVNVLSGTEHVPTEIPIGEDLDKLFGNNYVFGTEYTNGVPISHLEFPGGNPSTINSVKDISIRPLAGPSLRLPGNWLSKESGKVGTELNGPLGRSSSRLLGLVGALGIATSIVAGPEIAQASETESEIPLSEKVPGYSSLLDPDVPEEVISSALDQAALFVNAELVDKMAQIFFDQNNVYSSSLETKAGQKLIEVSGNSVSSRFTQQAQIFNQDLLNLAEEGKEIPTEKLNKLNIVRKFLELKGQEIKLLDKLPEEHVCNDVATPPSGEQGTYEQEWEMGTNKGEFTLKYNFYKQPDKIDIYYENNPKSIFSSEGFVSCDRTKGLQNKPTDYQCNTIDIYHGGPTSGGLGQLNKQECDTFGLPNSAYPHKISFPQGGTSTKVKAVVTAPCGTTAWVYKISCPQGVKQPPKLSNFYILSSNIYSDGLRKAALKTLLESGEAIGGTDTNSDAYIKNSTIFFKNLLRFGTDKQIKDFVKNKATNILTYFGAVINKLQSKISGDLYQTVYENSHIIDLLGILISENSAARTQSINIVKKLLSTGRGVYSDSKLIDLIIESFALETYESGKLTVIDSIPVTLLSNEKMFQFISGIVEDKNGYYRDQLLLKDVAINILTASGDPRAIEIIKDLSKKDEIKFAQSGTALNIVPVSVPPTIETNQQLNIQLFIPESNKDIKKIDTVDSIVKSDTGISSVTMVETGPNTGVFVFGTPVHIVDSRCSSGGPGCPQTGVRIVSTSGEDVRIFIGGSDVSVGVGSQEIESPFIDPKLLPIVRLFESSSASTLGSVKDKRIIVYVQDVPVAGDIRTISFGKSDFPNKRNGESVKKEIILGANGFVSSIDYSLTSVGECLVSLSCSWCGIKITSCQDEYASSEVKLYKDGKEIDSKKTGRLGHDKQATDIGSFTFNKFADKIEVIFNKEDDAGDYENLGLSITANTYSQAVNVKGREVFSLATQDGKITTALFGEIPNPTTKIIILKSLLEDIRQLPALQVQSAILNAVASKAIITLDENNQDAFKNKDILNLFSDIYGPLGVGDIKPGETKRIDNFQGWSGTLNVLVYDGVSIPGMINNGDTLRFVVPDSATYKGVIITLKGYPTGSCIVKPDKLPRGFETGESTIADCNRVVLPTGEKSKVLEFSGIETKGFVPEKDSSEITKIVFGCRDVKPSQNPIFSFKQGTTHTINGKEYTFYGNVLDEAILLYSKGYLTASPIVGFPSKVDGMVFRVTNFKKDSDGIPSFDLEVGGKEQPDIGTVFSECSEEGQLGCTSISKTIHKCLGGQNIITQQCDYGCNKWADNLLPECNKQPERKEKYSIYRIYNMPQTNLYSNYKTEFSAPHHFNLTTAYVMAFSSVRNDWIELLMIAPRDKGITETSPGYYTIEKQLSNQVESLDIDSSKGFYWVFGGYLVNYKGNLASLNGVPKQSCVGASGLEYSCEQRNAIPSYPYIRENPIKWGPNAMSNTNLVGNFKVKGDGQIVTYQGSKYKFGNTNNNKAILEIDGQRYEFDPGIPKTIGNKIVTVKDFFNYVYYPYDLNYMEVETSDPPSAPSSLSLIQFTPTNPPQPTKAAFQLALYTQGLPINKDITATSCVDQTVRLNEITTGIILKSLSETGGKATIYYTETPTKVPQVITTVAGRGEQGNSGDGGLAVDSTLGYIKGIGTDKNGNLFIADAYVYNVDNSVNSDVVHSYKIRMVNRSTGIISTVAGISKRIDAATTTVVGGHIESFSGDGGPADKAELKYPNDVAVDKDGNIYIADTNNQRIRKIDKKGIITTIAGTGERCNKPPQQCGDSGPATQALLDAPKRIAVDKDGNVYITSGLRVKKLKPEGTGYTISAIAGTGQPCGPLNPCGDNGIADQAQLGSISGLWINRDGDIYIADSGARRIRKVVGTTKIITSVASMQGDPIGIAGDQNGNIYTAYGISAAGSTVIKKGESGLIATIAGTGERCSPSTGFCGDNGPADNSQISSVEDLEVDTYGNIYVADQQSYKIRKISPQSQRAISPISAGDSFGPDPFFAGVSTANQVIEEKIETLYFSGEQIKIFGLDRKIAITRIIFGCSTEGLGGGNPTFSAYLINNTEKTQAIFDLNRVELTDCEEKEIQINSEPIDSIEINSLISSGGRAKIYYKETRTRVQPSPSPSPSSTAPTPTVIVNGNCADSDGGQNSFIKGITTYENGRILTDYCFNPTYVEEGYCDQTGNAKIISVGCISGCEDGACKRTVGECSDSDGGHEYYVKGETYGDSPSTNLPYKSYDTCDSTGQLIEHYCDSNRYHTNIVYNCPNKCLDGACVRSTGPIIKTIAGVGELCRSPTDPCGDNSSAISAKLNLINLVVDSSGNIYLSSYNKIRKIDKSTGIITTIAGTGAAGFSMDGKQANLLQLTSGAIEIDSSGNIYIADNSRIRKIDKNGIITTIAEIGEALNDIKLDSLGNIYLAGGTKIRKISSNGAITTIAGTGSSCPGWKDPCGDGGNATKAMLVIPKSITIDSRGNIYVLDNKRIRKIDNAGIITTIAGTGPFGVLGDDGNAAQATFGNYPSTLSIDSEDNLYISDSLNHRIRKINKSTGIITTIAGTGAAGFSGDGGPPDRAQLYRPEGIFVDSLGNIYIADSVNNRIRKAIFVQQPASPIQLLVDNLYGIMLNYWSFDKPYRCANDKLEDMGYRIEYEFVSGGPTYRMPVLYIAGGKRCDGSQQIAASSLSQNTIMIKRTPKVNLSYSLFDFSKNILTENINEDSLLALSMSQNVPEGWDIAIYADVAREDLMVRINKNQGTEATYATPRNSDDVTYDNCKQELSNPNNSIAITSRGKLDSPLCVKTSEGSIFKIIEDRKTSGDVYFKWMQLVNSSTTSPTQIQSTLTCPTIPIQPFVQPQQRIQTGCENSTNNTRSFGSFEKVGIDNQTGIQYLQGWVYDADGRLSGYTYHPNRQENQVEIKVEGVGTQGFFKSVIANLSRPDLPAGYSIPNTSINHGFKIPLSDIVDGTYTVSMFAVDPQTGRRKEIRRSPQEILVNVSRTDLKLTGINVLKFNVSSRLGLNVCIYGHRSIDDLQPFTPGLNGFPWKYEVIDSSGNKHEYAEQSQYYYGGVKNGRCFYLEHNLEPNHRSIFESTGKINVIIDPSDLIQEFDETNNKLTCVSGSCGTLKTQPTQSSVPAPITPSTCSGDISLTLSKTQVARQEVLTATASGLSGCDGRTVYIWQESTRSTQGWVSCSVSGTGCSTDIAAPYINKIYISKAAIDKNQNGNYADSGEITGNIQYTVSATAFTPSPSPTTTPSPSASPTSSPTPTTTFIPAPINTPLVKGTILTVAGNGEQGFTSDGVQATQTSLGFGGVTDKSPYGVALDSSGNLYIAQTRSQTGARVRKVDKNTGIISTVTGYMISGPQTINTTLSSLAGLTIDSQDNIYATTGKAIYRLRNGLIDKIAGHPDISGFSGDGGPAFTSQLNGASSVAVDSSGNIYIADTYNKRVRKVDKASGVITTIAGTGSQFGSRPTDGSLAISAWLDDPTDVALDSGGNIYIVDNGEHVVYKIDKNTGKISRFAGDTPSFSPGDGFDRQATSAGLRKPTEIYFDSLDNLYIVDSDNNKIKKVDKSSGILTVVAGTGIMGHSGDNGQAVSAMLYIPYGITVDKSGNIYITETISHVVRKIGGPV